MKKHFLLIVFIPLFVLYGFAQVDSLPTQTKLKTDSAEVSYSGIPQPVFKLKKGVDIPIILIGTGWSGYALTKIYNKNPSSLQQIQDLNIQNISGFNRWAATEYSKKAADLSNFFFYGAMPLPLLLLADKQVRDNIGTVSTLFLESISITGLLYTGSVYFVDKYRPLAYNPNVSLDLKIRGGAKNSFFAGHVALVGTCSFFIASIYAGYHPESHIRWVYYTAASAATLATAYLRYKGGQHFPSDILLGVGIGTLTGILVPSLHRNHKFNHPHLTLSPYIGESNGLTVLYKF
jgi:membrane-associated phospholipid phosphatase